MTEDKKRTIAITGTPGTGKSTLSNLLSNNFDYNLIDINELIEKEGIYELDSDGTKLVEPEDLRKSFDALKADLTNKNLVIDGLLSHLLSPDQVTDVVVLRTKPDVLEKRLESRDYSEAKIMENLEAEALGVLLQEAINNHGEKNVYEIDTTEVPPEESLTLFKKGLNGEIDLKPGSIDWLEDFYF